MSYILPEGVEAKKESVDLYRGKDHYFHEKELAEMELAIGQECRVCGKNTGYKSRLVCDACTTRLANEAYNNKPYTEWNGSDALVIYNTDIYFFNEDGLEQYCEENEIDSKDLKLMICEKEPVPQFSTSSFLEDSSEWFEEIPNEEEIDEKINKILQEQLSLYWISWVQGKYRTTVELE